MAKHLPVVLYCIWCRLFFLSCQTYSRTHRPAVREYFPAAKRVLRKRDRSLPAFSLFAPHLSEHRGTWERSCLTRPPLLPDSERRWGRMKGEGEREIERASEREKERSLETVSLIFMY